MTEKPHVHDENCDHEHDAPEQKQLEEITYSNHLLLNTLLSILIEKKVITNEELEKKIKEMYKTDKQ